MTYNFKIKSLQETKTSDKDFIMKFWTEILGPVNYNQTDFYSKNYPKFPNKKT